MTPTGTTGTITPLMRLSKTVHRATSESVLGMTFRMFWVLSILVGSDGVRPQNELCRQLLLDANNLVLLLNELEEAGYVRRERDAEDRRRHIVVLTDEGREAFARAERAQETVEEQVLARLDPEERRELRALLEKALGE
jgi:DNA-binding MarR family transcriptional regulator